jgi:C-lobe and N-lobe beta barrels of Tf-binding protein B
MMLQYQSLALACLVCFGLTGCGGGSPTAPPEPPVTGGSLPLQGISTETSTIRLIGYDSGSSRISTQSGALIRGTNRIDVGIVQGDIDSNRTYVAQDDGGSVALLYGSGVYSATFVAQPASGAPVFGVLGVPSSGDALPKSGSAIYAGTATVQIIDGLAVFDLTGQTNAEVNFGTALLDITMSGLSGQRSDSLGAPVLVDNVAVIDISGLRISGSTFAGGTVSLSSSILASSLTSAGVVQNAGGFFGPNGEELGGVFLVDDTLTGSLLLQGSFLGVK